MRLSDRQLEVLAVLAEGHKLSQRRERRYSWMYEWRSLDGGYIASLAHRLRDVRYDTIKALKARELVMQSGWFWIITDAGLAALKTAAKPAPEGRPCDPTEELRGAEFDADPTEGSQQ